MFFLAGYDTTANALSFLMYLLALNPEIQQKLYEEIVETLGDKVHLSFCNTRNERNRKKDGQYHLKAQFSCDGYPSNMFVFFLFWFWN